MDISVKMLAGIVTGAIIVMTLTIFLMGPFLSMFQEAKPKENGPSHSVLQSTQIMAELQEREPPVIQAKNVVSVVGKELNLLDMVSVAADANGQDLRAAVKISGDGIKPNQTTFSSQYPGIFSITFSVTDQYGLMTEQRISILINQPKAGGIES